MIPRYSREVMARIWTEENKFASWLKVELAAMETMAECGLIPPEVPARATSLAKIDVPCILEIEAKTHHDVAAFVDQVAACLGEDGRYFHFGLTSSDVLDTALGLRLTQAADFGGKVHALAVGLRFEFGNLPFDGGQGPAPGYVATLSEQMRAKLKTRLRETLPIDRDGSIRLTAKAWSVRGSK